MAVTPYNPNLPPEYQYMPLNANVPVIPAIAQAYQNDPRTKLAQAAITSGTSTDAVARGGYGYADGIARVLRGIVGGYVQKREQAKYTGYQNQTLAAMKQAAQAGLGTNPDGTPASSSVPPPNASIPAASTPDGSMPIAGTGPPPDPAASAPGAAVSPAIAAILSGVAQSPQAAVGPPQAPPGGLIPTAPIPTASPTAPTTGAPIGSPPLNTSGIGGASQAGTAVPFPASPVTALSDPSTTSGVSQALGDDQLPTPTATPSQTPSSAPTPSPGTASSGQAFVPVPDAPAAIPKPDMPTVAPAARSRMLDAAYQMMLMQNPFLFDDANKMYTQGLSDQDKINQAVVERQAELQKAGYVSDLEGHNASIQAQTNAAYQAQQQARGQNYTIANTANQEQFADTQRTKEEAFQAGQNALNRANTLAAARLRLSTTMPSADEQDAINQAVADGRLDLRGVTNRNAKVIGEALLANPNLNAVQLHAVANLQANASAQQKAGLLQSIPTVLKGVHDAGVALKLSDLGPIGDAQVALAKATNDPKWVELANRRVDASQTLSAVMGAAGATNLRTTMEQKAAAENMSPRAWNAWMKAQIGGVLPRMQWAESKGLVPQGTSKQMQDTYNSFGDTPGAAPGTVPTSSPASTGWGTASVVRP